MTGIGERLVDRAAGGLGAVVRAGVGDALGSALWHTLAWAVFGAGYVGPSFSFVGRGRDAGEVLLVLAAGARLSAYIGATVGEIGFLRGIWLDGSRRMAWLEDYAASIVGAADTPAPVVLRQGIRFEHVSFAYPGTERLVLDDVVWNCRRARWSRSWVRTGRGRARW